MNEKKVINAWAFFDWANSAYALTITATIFPIYYETITSTATSDSVLFLKHRFINTALYSYAIAFAFLLIASLSPFLSGIADYSGAKKRFMQFFCYLGSTSCILMFFFTRDNLWLGITLLILACIGHSGGIVFYNAYLPEIASPEKQDKVSAKGFSLGYFGSTLLLLFNLSMLLKPEWYGNVSTEMACRISFVSVGIWWVGFAQIPFYYLPIKPKQGQHLSEYLFKGYREIMEVWRQLRHTKRLTRFLMAFFSYNIGVQTIILLSTLFGKKEIHMGAYELIILILLIQYVAIAGSFFFAGLSRKVGNIRALQTAVFIWVLVCVSAYFIHSAMEFYLVAIFVGLLMGGTQALSRSSYSKMLPETLNHASFFSFYDICEKVGIVLGMVIFGLIETWTDSMRYPIISLIVFFILGFLLLSMDDKD